MNVLQTKHGCGVHSPKQECIPVGCVSSAAVDCLFCHGHTPVQYMPPVRYAPLSCSHTMHAPHHACPPPCMPPPCMPPPCMPPCHACPPFPHAPPLLHMPPFATHPRFTMHALLHNACPLFAMHSPICEQNDRCLLKHYLSATTVTNGKYSNEENIYFEENVSESLESTG